MTQTQDQARAVEEAIDRIEQRVLSSEASCEGETAPWADRARQKDADLRTLLTALDQAAEAIQTAMDSVVSIEHPKLPKEGCLGLGISAEAYTKLEAALATLKPEGEGS